MKKIIENFPHHFDDYECMWNGIEDIYMNKTGEKLPSQFFFAMSVFCSFAYIKTNKSDIKRMVSFGDGRTKQMYKFLAPIVNFDYHFIESKTPELALKKAKKEIDNDYPVVIGALDMYYLDYFEKIYHREHIPFHYFLMVGYDDEEEKVYFYDCGRKELMNISYNNLYLAMSASYKGLSNPNTICTIRMDKPTCKKEIFIACSRDKMSNVLIELGNEYDNTNIKNAGNLFSESGKCFEKLCDIFINYLLDKRNDINISSEILLNIADIEYRAYELISKGINEI